MEDRRIHDTVLIIKVDERRSENSLLKIILARRGPKPEVRSSGVSGHKNNLGDAMVGQEKKTGAISFQQKGEETLKSAAKLHTATVRPLVGASHRGHKVASL